MDPDDETLVRQFLEQGRTEDFEALVHRHQQKVFRLAVSVLGPGRETDAEDVTQEVFLLVYHKLGSFEGRSRFSTWLYRVAYRRAIDEARKIAARTETPMVPDLPGHSAAPDVLKSRALRECLDRLPEAPRTAMRLHYWLDHTVMEVAELIGTRPGTVKSWLFRGRELLARCLALKGIAL